MCMGRKDERKAGGGERMTGWRKTYGATGERGQCIGDLRESEENGEENC